MPFRMRFQRLFSVLCLCLIAFSVAGCDDSTPEAVMGLSYRALRMNDKLTFKSTLDGKALEELGDQYAIIRRMLLEYRFKLAETTVLSDSPAYYQVQVLGELKREGKLGYTPVLKACVLCQNHHCKITDIKFRYEGGSCASDLESLRKAQ